MTKKENIFHPLSLWKKKTVHLYLVAISKEITEFIFGQESPEQVFSFFSWDWPIRL